MITQSPTIHHASINGDAEIFGSGGARAFRYKDAEYAMTPRAYRELLGLTGLTQLGLNRMLEDGGQLRLGNYIREPTMANVQIAVEDRRVVAIDGGERTEIDCNRMLQALRQSGFSNKTMTIVDGVLTATMRTSQPFGITKDTFSSGVGVEIDLAGFKKPRVDTYLERTICVNGAVITIYGEDRIVPTYETRGDLNADTIAMHADAWHKASIPEIFKKRLEVAARTTASLAEVNGLASLLREADFADIRQNSASSRRIATIADAAFTLITGEPATRFGVASLKEIPARELKVLPSTASVLGVFNLGTEIATHHLRGGHGVTRLRNWWNTILNRQFDLEGTPSRDLLAPAFWLRESQPVHAEMN